ncbi:MAG: PASTA domain-containing protein [Acidobacteriota bacterium]
MAEPPKNVTEGANFHYDQRGNLVGTTAAGDIVEARHEENLPFDPNVVWERRDRLDSVNHRMLEDYVVVQLGDQSMAHCQGRYTSRPGVALKDLSGLAASEAKAQLKQAGLVVSITVGEEASSTREAFTVYAQDPGAGTAVSPGDEVELTILGGYNPRLAVPDLSPG